MENYEQLGQFYLGKAVNPETGPVSTETVAFRHVDSGYEED